MYYALLQCHSATFIDKNVISRLGLSLLLVLSSLSCETQLLNVEQDMQASEKKNLQPLKMWQGFFTLYKQAQLAFYVNLHRAVIGLSATLTGR